jgi:DNA-binding beta-propeller fold protein YncE
VDDFATDLVVSPDGARVFVAGFGRASLGVPHVFTLVGYGAAGGSKAGDATYGNGRDDMTTSASISTDGTRVYVAGGDQLDYLTVAFTTATVRVAWARAYDGGHGIDAAYGVAVSPDGVRVYVTGESEEGGRGCFGDIPSTAYATVEYDAATGQVGWAARYAGERRFPDQARFVAPSPDGSLVFVAGDSDAVCTSSDVATVAYEA